MPLLANADQQERIVGFFLRAGVLSAVVLTLQASAPLDESPNAPAWINAACVALTLVLLFLFVRLGTTVEKVAAVFAALATLHAVTIPGLWTVQTQAEFASICASVAGGTWNGLPMVALAYGWGILSVGYLCARGLLLLTDESDGLLAQTSAWFVGGLVTAFGVRGLLGYASGSVSLLLG